MKEGFKATQRLRASGVCVSGGGEVDKTNKFKKGTGTYLALACFAGAQQNIHRPEHPDADPLPRQALISACFTSILPTPVTDVTLGFLSDL